MQSSLRNLLKRQSLVALLATALTCAGCYFAYRWGYFGGKRRQASPPPDSKAAPDNPFVSRDIKDIKNAAARLKLKPFKAQLLSSLHATDVLTDVRVPSESVPAKGWTTKTFYFTRHGQGYHNLAALNSGRHCDCEAPNPSGECPYLNKDLLDPELTTKGREEADALAPRVEKLPCPDVVYTSPLIRATQTAIAAFQFVYPANSVKLPPGRTRLPKWVADERIREQAGLHQCDRRLSVRELARKFPGVNYAGLSDQDPIWTVEREPREKTIQRGHDFIRSVMKSPENIVAVVTHSSFLLTLNNAILDFGEDPAANSWFKTGELRIVRVTCPTSETRGS